MADLGAYPLIQVEVMPNNERAPGLLHHIDAVLTDPGNMMEVWEWQEALDRFVQEKRAPATQRSTLACQHGQVKEALDDPTASPDRPSDPRREAGLPS